MSVATRKEHAEMLKPLLHKLASMRQEAPVPRKTTTPTVAPSR